MQKLIAIAGQRFASAGPQLLELGAAIAEGCADLPSAARLFAMAAKRARRTRRS